MPLTAWHVDERRIDSTDDEQWAEVHVAGYQGLICPECAYGMYARKSGKTVRHFAHRAGRPSSCSLTAAESAEHLHTKVLVAEAVRTLGWTATIECPGDGWRADVLAVSPSGQRCIAFEPQFAKIHESVARERVQRHQASDVTTIWLDARGQESLAAFSRGRLFYDERDPRVGVQTFSGRSWGPHRLPLSVFIQRVCVDRLTHDGNYWADEKDRAAAARWTQEEAERRAEQERLAEARRELHRKHEEARVEQARKRAEEQEAHLNREIAAQREKRAQLEAQWEQERQERAASERKAAAEREREEQERRDREAAEQWERERPERERQERAAAEHERKRQERAAEWPIERIRALMAATREELR